MSTTATTDAPSTAQTHLSFCTGHGTLPADVNDGGRGWCRDQVILHGVKITLAEQLDGEDENGVWIYSEPRCEIDSAFDDDALTPDQMRELAALLIDKADVLEAVIDPETAAQTAASYEVMSNGAQALIDSRNGDRVNVEHVRRLADVLGIDGAEIIDPA